MRGDNLGSDAEVLDPVSRVIYGKAYAVEHNAKVLDIGMVTENQRYLPARQLLRRCDAWEQE
jgi:hypothetical protein